MEESNLYGIPVTFDEFSDKLREIKSDYLKAHGRELHTVEELENYLIRRKVSKKKTRALKSLKGFSL